MDQFSGETGLGGGPRWALFIFPPGGEGETKRNTENDSLSSSDGTDRCECFLFGPHASYLTRELQPDRHRQWRCAV